jgi:hypothetical protein
VQIRHKLLLWFTGLVSVLLLAFSAYVYLSYADFRVEAFKQRLVRKAELLYQVLDDAHVHEALATLPEQGGYIYSPTDRLLYIGTNSGDFQPSASFLAHVRKQGRVAFDFTSAGHTYPKEGVALTFRRPGEPGLYLAIVTAYDNAGFVRERTLLEMLLYGYLGAIIGSRTRVGICTLGAIAVQSPYRAATATRSNAELSLAPPEL